MGITRRLGHSLPATLAIALLAWSTAAPSASAASPVIEDARVLDSPFSPNGDGMRERALLDVSLGRAALVTVLVLDFDGRVLRTLASEVARDAGTWRWTWNGHDRDGRRVPDGPYRFVVRASDPAAPGLAPDVATMWVAKARRIPYPARPGAITVAVNAGHGGRDPGAPYRGLDEKDVDLDIALRLRAMLVASGIDVVMTRTTDHEVNRPRVDVTGDGVIDQADELAARIDIANVARAAAHLNLHNNASACRCARGTEVYTHDQRSWTPEGRALARRILRSHIGRLLTFASARWRPVDRGVKYHDFYVMRPYDPWRVPRPSLMPTILGESLFGDHGVEGRLLQRKRVRGAIAVAYFDGLARWLDQRAYGIRYEVLDAASSAKAGGTLRYGVRLTNTGNRASAGWRLEARAVSAVPVYDGSGRSGRLLAATVVPDGLAPGASVELTLEDVPAPSDVGDWLVKLDVRLPSGETLGSHGVVGPQLPLRTSRPP